MIFKFKTALLTAAAIGAMALPAKAEMFVLQDPDSKLTVAYPDTWRRVHNQKPDDVITLAGPGIQDFASCRVRIRPENRYTVYPARYADNLNRTVFDEAFWKEYLAENKFYRIDNIKQDGSLGRGFANYVNATYMSFDDPKQTKQAVIYASLYNDHIYIVDCSAKREVFEKWHPQFTGIIKSVDFRKEIHELPTGDYRDFLADEPLWIRNSERFIRFYRYDEFYQYW